MKIEIIVINYILKIHLASYFYTEVKKRPPFENLFFSRKSGLRVLCFEVTFSVFSHLSLLVVCIGIIFINYVLKFHLVSYFYIEE